MPWKQTEVCCWSLSPERTKHVDCFFFVFHCVTCVAVEKETESLGRKKCHFTYLAYGFRNLADFFSAVENGCPK